MVSTMKYVLDFWKEGVLENKYKWVENLGGSIFNII